jgi:hypothetical protein
MKLLETFVEIRGWRAVGALAVALMPTACSNGDDAGGPSTGGPTWHQDVAPLVAEKCGSCHAAGGIAPFSVADYASAKDWSKLMAKEVEAGTMPPFLAQETAECTPKLGWAQDLRLSADQKRLLRDWADAGAPEGDAKSAAHVNQPALVAIEREDVAIRLPQPVTVDGDRDIHRCIVVDPGLTEDSYIVSRHVTAGNAKVVHHVVAYMVLPGANAAGTPRTKAQLEQAIRDAQGVGVGGSYDCFGGPGLPDLGIEMLTAWAPGSVPSRAPPNTAQPIDKDALILLDTHYHPTGQSEVDSDTKLSLMLGDGKPMYESRGALIGNVEEPLQSAQITGILVQQPDETKAEFVIPAGASQHVEEMNFTFTFPETSEVRIYGAGTHMHYVGRDMRVSLTHAATNETECLIETPNWDFDWQRGYAYDADALEDLPVLRSGDTLHLRCVYDNTTQNPHVREALEERGLDAPVPVKLGEDTLDEMCLTGLGAIFVTP